MGDWVDFPRPARDVKRKPAKSRIGIGATPASRQFRLTANTVTPPIRPPHQSGPITSPPARVIADFIVFGEILVVSSRRTVCRRIEEVAGRMVRRQQRVHPFTQISIPGAGTIKVRAAFAGRKADGLRENGDIPVGVVVHMLLINTHSGIFAAKG